MKHATIPTQSGTYTAEYTNTCSCQDYDPETGDYKSSDDCYGFCWDDTIMDFTNITEHLFVENSQGFRIEGFPVWNGTVDGYFTARNATELLDSMTPDRTEWRMEVTVHADRIVARLYHHDAPTGGTMTVTPIVDDDE